MKSYSLMAMASLIGALLLSSCMMDSEGHLGSGLDQKFINSTLQSADKTYGTNHETLK